VYRNMPLYLLLAAALGGPALSSAETIYRCGESYSQQPCPGGKAVQTDDPRSEGQRAQTREAVRRDAKAADEMEKTRLKEEAKPAQALMPAPKSETPQPPDGPVVTPGVARKPAYFTAVSPAKKGQAQPGKKKKKAKKKPTVPVQTSRNWQGLLPAASA
jgi:hypothetical protein